MKRTVQQLYSIYVDFTFHPFGTVDRHSIRRVHLHNVNGFYRSCPTLQYTLLTLISLFVWRKCNPINRWKRIYIITRLVPHTNTHKHKQFSTTNIWILWILILCSLRLTWFYLFFPHVFNSLDNRPTVARWMLQLYCPLFLSKSVDVLIAIKMKIKIFTYWSQ